MSRNDTYNIVFQFICGFKKEHGYSPSFREIAAGTGKGLTTVSYHLDNLRAMGKIDFQDGISRSIVICEEGLGDGRST